MNTGTGPSELAPAVEADVRARVAGLLELALRPQLTADVLDARVEGLLRRLAPIPLSGAAGPTEIRLALVHAAGQVLAAEDPEALLARMDFAQRRSSLVRSILECLGDASAIETNTLEELEAGAAASPLAADALAFAEADVEALRDAQRLVRIVAVATRAAADPDAGRRAARALLALPVGAFEELLDPAWLPAEEGSAPSVLPDPAALLAQVEDLLRVHRLLGALDGETHARRRHGHLLAVLRSELGADAALALAEEDERLVLHGLTDLEGTSLRVDGGESLAARALAAGEALELPADDAAPVLDRQIARRLGADALRAVPMFAPEPVGVLLVPATTDAFLSRALAALAAPGLLLPIRFERRVLEAGLSVQSRYERRLREVVHEANNPLSVIHNYLHVLGARLDDESTSREQLRLIGDEIGRTSEILHALVDAPAGVEARRPAQSGPSLHALVRDVLALLEPSLMADAGIELVTEFDAVDVTPALDTPQLRQVLLNLLKNAVEAMPEGGRIVLATHTALATSSGPGFEISITDSGAGIPPDLLRGLFARGTSTKGDGRGLGLGIVRQLVEALGGNVSAQSHPGRGTTFRLVFPVD